MPEEECQITCEVARSAGLELGSFPKDNEVPGGSDGIVCPRRSAELCVRLPCKEDWSLVVLQSTRGLG